MLNNTNSILLESNNYSLFKLQLEGTQKVSIHFQYLNTKELSSFTLSSLICHLRHCGIFHSNSALAFMSYGFVYLFAYLFMNFFQLVNMLTESLSTTKIVFKSIFLMNFFYIVNKSISSYCIP